MLYEEIDVTRYQSRPPLLFNTLTEAPRALFEASHLLAMMPSLSLSARGDKHPLLMIPGFLAGDASMAMMKRYLAWMGYQPQTWGLGRNFGHPEHLFDHLPERLIEIAETAGEPVSLIGQSLGGVFARELAREFPDHVRQVITLGSPFGVSDNAGTLRTLAKLFRTTSGKTTQEMMSLMRDRSLHESPNVPVTAIYSKGDGVVNWEACLEEKEDCLTQNIEVPGSHCGMAFNSTIYYIIANRLSQAVKSWEKFRWQLSR